MKWTERHDIEFCKEVIVSKLFGTRKKSAERGKVWETIAQNLEKLEFPKFKVDQRSVRDRLKKLLLQFQRKDRIERSSSGISPEQTELDALLEEISAREEASETLAAEAASKGGKKMEGNRMAAQEMRHKAMEKLSETKKRKANGEGSGMKKKVRRGGNPTLEFLKEKAEKEMIIKEKAASLDRDRLNMERERMEQLMGQQSNMWTAFCEMQNKQNQQLQSTQMLIMQQQQQQGQALLALLEKISSHEG